MLVLVFPLVWILSTCGASCVVLTMPRGLCRPVWLVRTAAGIVRGLAMGTWYLWKRISRAPAARVWDELSASCSQDASRAGGRLRTAQTRAGCTWTQGRQGLLALMSEVTAALGHPVCTLRWGQRAAEGPWQPRLLQNNQPHSSSGSACPRLCLHRLCWQ